MQQKTILCYGDSNTWGYVPLANHDEAKQRYPRSIRWPGLLQSQLGDEYYIVEEGLNSRTTNIDYDRPPDRNGKTYLAPCLYSHAPIDLVILALGGNDTKTYFNRSAQQICDGLFDLVDEIMQSEYGVSLNLAPKVLVLSPVIPMKKVESYVDEEGVAFLENAVEKTNELLRLCEATSKARGCDYLDLSGNVHPSSVDGVHYDESAHAQCAKMVSQKVKDIFNQV